MILFKNVKQSRISFKFINNDLTMVILTIGGPPGSGTSTVCNILRERTGWTYIYAGEIFREMANEKEMTLNELGYLCEKDPKIDMELDERMMKDARMNEDIILEGRMIGPLCKKENIPSLKIYIDADPKIRAKRVNERDGGDIEKVIVQMRIREGSEVKRYLKYYNIDPRMKNHYDMIVDSSSITPDEEADLIISKLEGM